MAKKRNPNIVTVRLKDDNLAALELIENKLVPNSGMSKNAYLEAVLVKHAKENKPLKKQTKID